jgi:hypothetical protein
MRPQRLLKDRPASSRSLLVTAELQLAWTIFSRSSHTLPDSGEPELKPPLSAIQLSPRSRHCSPPFEYDEPVQFFW